MGQQSRSSSVRLVPSQSSIRGRGRGELEGEPGGTHSLHTASKRQGPASFGRVFRGDTTDRASMQLIASRSTVLASLNDTTRDDEPRPSPDA